MYFTPHTSQTHGLFLCSVISSLCRSRYCLRCSRMYSLFASRCSFRCSLCSASYFLSYYFFVRPGMHLFKDARSSSIYLRSIVLASNASAHDRVSINVIPQLPHPLVSLTPWYTFILCFCSFHYYMIFYVGFFSFGSQSYDQHRYL